MIIVSKLASPEQAGDWHDKPLKWKVEGPGTEVQKFSTRKDAEQYHRLRKDMGQYAAIRAYVMGRESTFIKKIRSTTAEYVKAGGRMPLKP